ncbi:LysR family transcriptional regulator [Streptomyces sp. CB01881]|uniref:LysR family transcriptional regulator n=1 Tax=Streptomyces sp. CB01881 TaxID=2078691 RepID=UPI000CDC3B34|nr:LysR family transcriptional regulator [Streptomyces sp. CB01881]AUY52225.1 LysR family transcriptional regulator [Streptomyces sp. CB01881]TYC71650.1 LysR family transcriptional regulator [Streptomyces sp. CB01881]
MDPHQLRTFVTVARLGSFSEAARELGYTQSAVSQQIAALEADLGSSLLVRRPVGPTEAGVRLLEHAGPLLLRLDAARADVARLAGTPSARLLLGTTALAAGATLGNALAEVRRAYPRMDLTVRVVAQETLPALVATGEVDLALIDGLAAPSDPLPLPDVGPLTTVAVDEQPLAVALPAGHPLAGHRGVSLADLSAARWLDAPDIAPAAARLRAATAVDGFRPAARYRGADVRGLLALVAAGHGLAVLPAAALDGVVGVAAVPVREPRLVHRTELVHGSLPEGPAALLAQLLEG